MSVSQSDCDGASNTRLLYYCIHEHHYDKGVTGDDPCDRVAQSRRSHFDYEWTILRKANPYFFFVETSWKCHNNGTVATTVCIQMNRAGYNNTRIRDTCQRSSQYDLTQTLSLKVYKVARNLHGKRLFSRANFCKLFVHLYTFKPTVYWLSVWVRSYWEAL